MGGTSARNPDKGDLKEDKKPSRLDGKKLLVFMMPHKSPETSFPSFQEEESMPEDEFGSGNYKKFSGS